MFRQIDTTELLRVIKEVHADHGDDLCWLSIDKIFNAAGLPVPDRCVGDKEAMKKNCHRYIDVMCSGGKWKSYAELEEELKAIKAAVVSFFAAQELLCEPKAPKTLEEIEKFLDDSFTGNLALKLAKTKLILLAATPENKETNASSTVQPGDLAQHLASGGC